MRLYKNKEGDTRTWKRKIGLFCYVSFAFTPSNLNILLFNLVYLVYLNILFGSFPQFIPLKNK
jgi:hypothetical protein